MKIKLFKKYYTIHEGYQGIDFIIFKTKWFQFKWFTDYGEWFVYIYLGKRWVRFSSCGFMKGNGDNC